MRRILLFILFSWACVGTLSAAITYSLTINGVSDTEIILQIKEHTELYSERHSQPSTLAKLKFRATSDIPTILTILHNHGYYDAMAQTQIEQAENGFTQVFVDIVLGRQYTFSNIEIDPPYDCGIPQGSPALATETMRAESEMIAHLQDNGHPYARTVVNKIIVDKGDKTADFILTAERGPYFLFGNTIIEGLDSVQQQFILQNITWNDGEQFSTTALLETEKKLKDSGLFAFISLSYPEEPTKDTTIPITITLNERFHRSISASIGYSTNLGTELTFEWAHRNIRGLGEKISYLFDITEKQQQMSISYRKPHFQQSQQDLVVSLSSSRETTTGYKAYTTSLKGMIERDVNPSISLAFGATLNQVNTSPPSEDRDSYSLIGFPYYITWDRTDDMLDPTHGTHISARLTPFINIQRWEDSFVQHTVSGVYLLTPIGDDSMTMLFSASFGFLFGASLHDIPPPNRFYGGSATFLRGYKYRTVSPQDSTGRPIGGRATMYYTVEARAKVTDNMKGTLFYDFGNVFAESWPKFNKKLFRSWGCGIQYRTPIGPFRCEIAFPLDKRDGLDKSSHIYISIGRSF